MVKNTFRSIVDLPDILNSIDFEGVLPHLNDSIIITYLLDESGPVIVWANDVFYQLSGYESAEVIGKSPLFLQGPLTDKATLKRLRTALEKSKYCKVELLNYKKDGSIFWNELEVTPIKNELGVCSHFISIQRDITERKRLEEALKESESRFRRLSDFAPIGLFTSDSQGNCTYTNERWQEIFGLNFKESIGAGWQSGIHPDDRANVYDNWLSNASTKLEFDSIFRTLDKNNSVRFVHSKARPTLSAEGDITGYIGTVVDITEQTKKEKAIQKSSQLLQETGTMAGIGAWEVDLINNSLFWSERTCEIHGVPEGYRPQLDEAINFYAPDARPVVKAALDNAVLTGENWDLELPFIQLDGTPIWVRAMGSVVYADNKPVRLVGAFQDITEKVEQRMLLERTNERISLATDSGGIGIWEYNLINDELLWDEQMYKLYGVAPETNKQAYQLWASHLHPDDKEQSEAILNDAIAGSHDFDTEFRVIWSDGSIHYLRAFARLIHDSNGTPLKLMGVNWDNTSMRTLTNELAEQYELMQVTLQSIGDAVITTDKFGNTKWLNPVAENITAWSNKEAFGLPIDQVFNVVDEATGSATENPVSICLTNKVTGPLKHSQTLVSRNGTKFGIEDSASPILNKKGDLMGVVLVFRDVTEQRRLNQEITHQAKHDSLTGLLNRAAFETRLSRLLSLSQKEQSQHALMYVDLDQFKIVNDTCGHSIGDKLLKIIAKMLSETVRNNDTLARLGGDEFGIILEQCTTKQAQHVGQKICDKLEAFRFIHDEQRFRIGTSIGLVAINHTWANMSAIMQAADTACYAAKDAGRNRVHTWLDSDESMQARKVETQWITQIERALDEDRFVLYAQLLNDLSGKDVGYNAEVLLRMLDSQGEIIPPNAFLPAAERFHLASRIDRWVLRNAINWLISRHANDTQINTLFINLSGQSLGDRSFHAHASELFKRAGGAVCKKICVEITETAAITNMTDANLFIEQLKQFGVKVALDDFGAGAASFGYLKHLKIDILKIDGQFISDLLNDPLDDVAVRFFIEVARVMNLKTVAEFVDKPEVLARVKELGIDYAQGFLLHKPEPINLAVCSK